VRAARRQSTEAQPAQSCGRGWHRAVPRVVEAQLRA
jgi:hypothetical protein